MNMELLVSEDELRFSLVCELELLNFAFLPPVP